MKSAFVLLAMVFTTLSFAHADDSDCSADRFMAAIQKKCGDSVKFAGKVYGPFQGEVDDSYNIAVTDGKTTKNMECEIEGGVQCTVDTIEVKSLCP